MSAAVEGQSDAAAGSFRDPAARVFFHQGEVYRGVDDAAHRTLDDLAIAGLLQRLVDDGSLTPSQWVEDPALLRELTAIQPGFRHFLRHRRIPTLSWPYEWTISMLANVAALTLDLQLRLLQSGFALKDASAYNVQFVAGRPQWIDLGSIERPPRPDLWYALGQFSQMFTFPLLLCRRAGWDLRSYFLANLAGLERFARGGGVRNARPLAAVAAVGTSPCRRC